MIIRGTTPYHSFIVPLAAEQIDEVYITYLQNEEVILDKSKSDVEIIDIVPEELENEESEEAVEVDTSSEIRIHLSQEDTLKFKFYPAAEKNIAVVQLRILDTNNEAYASDPVHERIYGILKEGVIGADETNTDNETI